MTSANRAPALPLSQSSRSVAFVSSPPSSWPLAYTPRRHRRWRRGPLARFPALASSLNERLVCEPFARRAIYEAFDPRQGMVLNVALVQPERKLVNVAVKMLRAGVMIDADQPALQDHGDRCPPVRLQCLLQETLGGGVRRGPPKVSTNPSVALQHG
jgi:hypothetical protein